MPPPLANLPESPRAAVFRQAVALLQNDPVLKLAVKSWKVYAGDRDSVRPFATGELPGVRIARSNGPAAWYSPDAQESPIYLDVTIEVPGWNSDDVDNLWYAIERVFYPPNPGGTEPTPGEVVREAFRNAGALTGLAEFTVPAFDPVQVDESGDRLVARGQIKIDAYLQFNV